MISIKTEKFNIAGIAIRTSNENGQSGIDIPELWKKFISEETLGKIPGKIDNTVYCVYTDYEKDHTKPYTAIIGCKVSDLENIPEGMRGKTIDEGNYLKFTAKGNMINGIVYKEWIKIWNSDIPRSYTSDFEVYGEKSYNPVKAEIDIFVAIKD